MERQRTGKKKVWGARLHTVWEKKISFDGCQNRICGGGDEAGLGTKIRQAGRWKGGHEDNEARIPQKGKGQGKEGRKK